MIILRSNKSPLIQLQRIGFPAFIAGISLVAAYSGGVYSIQTTSVASAMLLFATAPFMAAVLGWIFLQENVRTATWISIVIAVFGISIMVADKTGPNELRGNAAALGSAFGFAVFTVALRWGKLGDMLPTVFLSGLFGVIITLFVCLFVDLPILLSFNDSVISAGMGVFQVGAGLVLYTLGSRTIKAADLALLSLAEVLLGPFWVWIILDEAVAENTFIGGVLLLIAIAGNATSGKRQNPLPFTSP